MCLTLIMAHANEGAALKSKEACLPDSVCGGVVCHCGNVTVLCVLGSASVCMCARKGYFVWWELESLFRYLKVDSRNETPGQPPLYLCIPAMVPILALILS